MSDLLIELLRSQLAVAQRQLSSLTGGDGFCCGAVEGVGIFKGGCGENVNFYDAYRCADCTASFHRGCIRKHFRAEGDGNG